MVELGRAVGPAIQHLISIVTPRTFARWMKADSEAPKTAPAQPRPPGRPKTDVDIQSLVLRLARENAWGYTRILGELKKLGVGKISRSTVVNILKENGLDPGPKRGKGTWHEFVRRHAETLWACDFFTKKTWTFGGLVDVYVLFFIHIGTRRVHIAGMTANPDNAWMVQQARNMSMVFAEQPTPPKYLIMDMDAKFTANFRATLEADNVESVRVGPLAPNLNAFAERWVQTIRRECLDHFVCFGIDHLRHIVKEFEAFYNQNRPHQSLGNRPIPDAQSEAPATLPFPGGAIACKQRLGGVLKHYYPQAA